MNEPFPEDYPRGGRSDDSPRSSVADRLAQFEQRQRDLWLFTYVLLGLLTLAYAFASWHVIRSFARRFEFLLPALVIVVAAIIIYAWKRNKEIAELRGLVRGIEQRAATPPSDRQLDKLFAVIEKSQQGYRDLIDSFDDVLIAVTLDGEIRAANRSFADLVGATFQEIIGKPLVEFIEDGGGEGPNLLERHLPRFLETRHWTGVIQVKVKKRNSINYFDCVIHAMSRD